MKTLINKETKISLELFPKEEFINIKNDRVVVGDPEKYTIWNCNKFTCELITVSDVPSNWSPNRYFLDGTWIPNKDWVPQTIQDKNAYKAEILLKESDWTQYPDVTDTTKNPHLVNYQEWVDYRNALRIIAINTPETENVNWPAKPTKQWSV